MNNPLFDEIKLFLPKYLSPESEKELLNSLRDYPENMNKKMYSQIDFDDDKIYQGDGLNGLLIFDLPHLKQKISSAIILSNSCDIDLDNKRIFDSNICYAPLVNFEKYIDRIRSKTKWSNDKIENHISAIKNQRITQIFFIPKYGKLDYDALIFFDKITSLKNSSIDRTDIHKKRLFRLSQYGHYLFIFKLSVHFTRINESIDRKPD